MNRVEIKVTKCRECPFAEKHHEENTASCYAPIEIHKGNYDITDFYDFGKQADFCPLLKNTLIISSKNT
jgi:hypothetical protein